MSESKKIILSERQLCDLELIVNGGFAPLKGFLNEKDYTTVIESMRLSSGTLWPIPIVLDVPDGSKYSIGEKVILCDVYNKPVANLTIESIYELNKKKEAKNVYKTTSEDHFGVNYLFHKTHQYALGGTVKSLGKIDRPDFANLRLTPKQLKSWFKKNGWKKIIGFQTRNPMHQAHYWLVKNAADQHRAKVLIHPAVGLTKDGDIDYITRVKCYKVIVKKYAKEFAKLSLLPLAMRMAGPREALLHAIIRKNYGCTHFIIGRAHADPGNDSFGKSFYDPYDAQKLVSEYAKEIGITIVPFKEMAYEEKENKYISEEHIEKHHSIKRISGTEFRRMLFNSEKIPSWFSFPEVLRILKKRSRQKRGVTVFFTGLPCSGKSTLARALASKIQEKYLRNVTLLDGDVVRQHLSAELGFSEDDRKKNIRRIGFVSHEIVKHGGVVVCAALSPYEDVRKEVRNMIQKDGHYVEIYLSTPLETCKKRDIKGLYKKAEEGIIKHVTGIDDPYEIPKNPQIIIDTTKQSVNKSLSKIMRYLRKTHAV